MLLTGFATRIAAGHVRRHLLAFVIGFASAWARGLTIDCGCFGGGGEVAASESRYPQEIARDISLIAAAAVLACRPWSRFAVDNAIH